MLSSLAAGVLRDGLGTLTDSMFSQLAGQNKTDSGLDLSRGDSGFPVVVSKAGGLASDALEDVIDEGVHDAHGLARHTGVGVDLLHDLVNVHGIAFPSSSCASSSCLQTWVSFRLASFRLLSLLLA